MKRVLVTFIVLFLSLLLANHAQAGTLDRGVHIGPFFIAGGANGDPTIAQLKYQMAIDSWIGFKNRYTTIMYNYDYSTNNNSGTFNTFDVEASGYASIIVNNTTY